jgi:multicomponent Na+:H+ antiporter subunit D
MTSVVLFAVLTPFFAAVLLGIVHRLPVIGERNVQGPISLFATALSVTGGALTLSEVVHHYNSSGDAKVALSYHLGGWQPPLGIEFRLDGVNALMLLLVGVVCLVACISSYHEVARESKIKRLQWCSLALLFQTGVSGMIATGDLFNVYVFLEVAALTGYALLSFTGGKSYVSTLHYVLIGSIGACFYLLGVGYLYAKTGTLNMANMQLLLAGELRASAAVKTAALFCFLGMAIKLGVFPFHGWLPNAYSYSSNRATALVAPLASKTAAYVAVRLAISVFPSVLVTSQTIVYCASFGIIAATVMAFRQNSLKRMICYLMIAEAGYLVGGLFLGNSTAMLGTAYHIIADGLMTLALFLAVMATMPSRSAAGSEGCGVFALSPTGHPYAFALFLLASLSMIGVPPLPGFYSKWLLIQGGGVAGNWPFIAALLTSSIGNLALFLRQFERGYFGHLDEVSHLETTRGWLATLGLWLSGISLVAYGVFNSTITKTVMGALFYSGYIERVGY